MAITWIRPPSHIAATLAKRTDAMEPALEALAAATGSRGEAQMKANAPWTDRTGAARAGLFGQADGTDVVLGGTVHYQGYLELGTSRMSAYPIIVPTANEIAPRHFEDAGQTVMRLLGSG